jgi:hypothetical protein
MRVPSGLLRLAQVLEAEAVRKQFGDGGLLDSVLTASKSAHPILCIRFSPMASTWSWNFDSSVILD